MRSSSTGRSSSLNAWRSSQDSAACTLAPTADRPAAGRLPMTRRSSNLRFREIDPADLDLAGFWTDASVRLQQIEAHPDSPSIRSPNIGELRFRTWNRQPVYARAAGERGAYRASSRPNLLPIRIPLLSAVLDYIPFQVPIPYKSEGFSLGSGFFINDAGFILTNAHVVQNATDVRVVRSGRTRKSMPAKIIGIDPLSDTRVDPDRTPGPRRRSSPSEARTALEVGEMVVAVGNPLGLNHTVTSGPGKRQGAHRSRRSRFARRLSANRLGDQIPGSSGGPLLNLRGEVVGINTAIVSDAQNIGFAIPIDTVKRVKPLLVSGRSDRGWFGAAARPLEPGEAGPLGETNPDAVIVDRVIPDSPAARSGLREGDVVRRVGGVEIPNFVVFRRQLIGMLPGQNVSMTLSRAGESVEIHSTLVDRPEED